MTPHNKRRREGVESNTSTSQKPTVKRPRLGLPVDPANLPDGPWKRKLTKVKKELFHQKKVEKNYAKVKARYQRQNDQRNKVAAGDHVHVHPDRQAAITNEQNALNEEDTTQPSTEELPASAPRSQSPPGAISSNLAIDKAKTSAASPGNRQRRRPNYFNKELAAAEEHKRAATERESQAKAHEEDRARKMAERDWLRKAMAKAKKPSAVPGRPGGRVKLGRESGILLDRVKKMICQNR